MELSPKAIRFVIEALEHYRQLQDGRLAQPGLTEEEISDLVNDQHYLEAIRQEFEQYRDQLAEQREPVRSDA